MQVDIMTLFPEMLIKITQTSIMKRAIERKILKVNFHQIRDFALDKHKTVDDTTYGHGKGMLLKAEPIFLCFEKVTAFFICYSLKHVYIFIHIFS